MSGWTLPPRDDERTEAALDVAIFVAVQALIVALVIYGVPWAYAGP